MNRHIAKLKHVIPIVAFSFLVYIVLQNSDNLSSKTLSIDIPTLTLSTALLMIVFIADGLGWHLIVRALCVKERFSVTLPIWFYSSFTRYIPGIVWPYATRIKLCSDIGISKITTANSMLLENVFLASSALIASLPIALHHFDRSALALFIILTIATITLTKPILLLSQKIKSLPNVLTNAINSLLSISFRSILKLGFYYLMFWFCFSLSFGVFCLAITDSRLIEENIIYIAICFPISFFIGFTATITPGGLGIREGALYTLLLLYVEPQHAAILAIASRLWIISAELLIGLCLVTTSTRRSH